MSELGQDKPKPILPWSVYGYTLVASFSSFVYGYNTGIIAPAIIFIPKSIPLSLEETSAIVSIILIGAMLGSWLSGLLADWLGRRNVLAFNNALMLAAAICASLGEGSWLLLTSRAVLGLGVGVASVVPGLYITEMAPAHVRGKLGAINQLFGWMGIIVAYFIGYEIVVCTAGDLCWRYMFSSGAVLCIFHFILVMSLLPDTPRWLVSQGKTEHALHILQRIYGDDQEALVIQQFQVVHDRRHHKESLFLTTDEIKDPVNTRPLLTALALQVFQQACGNSAIVYYSTLVFHALGYAPRAALFFNAIASIPQLVALIIVVLSLDRHGRRPALLISQTGVTFSLILLASSALFDDLSQQFWPLFLGLVLHRLFFACGLGPVPSVHAAESLPFAIRGRALSLAISLNWACNFVITASFPFLFTRLTPLYVYGAFAAFTLLGLIFVGLFVRETKGVALEAIESPPKTRAIPEIFSLTSPPISTGLR